MSHGGGVDGREGSGSGLLLTESSDISRRIRSNLLSRERERDSGVCGCVLTLLWLPDRKCPFISIISHLMQLSLQAQFSFCIIFENPGHKHPLSLTFKEEFRDTASE